ncbi:hypothetical protein GQ44DRAFT_704870 [Phaeosphaeriaceae sp. PMI808]|nr:hypothetical protein GQ44DRAFT_704870 [Phaeosphaeriaceae sp. PMI808]
MATSTPNSISRYRPALLILAGAAAAYATYLVYSVSQSSSRDGLHRSNAIRRPNARQHSQALLRPARPDVRLEGAVHTLPGYNLNGTHIPFEPHHVISPNELRHLITQQHPHITPEEMEMTIEHVYMVYLDQLIALILADRLPSHNDAQSITEFIANHHDGSLWDSATVARAIERYNSTIQNSRMPEADGAESVVPTELSVRSDNETEGDATDLEGQTLQRTLYHIAEDRARQEGVVHRGITCNACDEKPIRGIRWHCANCADYDLCSNCEATDSHIRTHIFYKIRVPAPYLGMAKQEPLYPGKPHMMAISVHSVLKKRLVAETNMEIEEIDGLWDQFTCLAGTEWIADPNHIGWALDRLAFNHAFIPRYKSFVASPNLIYDRIFAFYDSDKNGLIGFEEWIKGLDGMHSMNGRAKSRIVFDGYDIDGDGYISRRDVLRLFRAYYAIEKEATRNYVSEITEEISVDNALNTIRSSQPLGSAFPPPGLDTRYNGNPRLLEKHQDEFENVEPILLDDQPDTASRDEVLIVTNLREMDYQDDPVRHRWARRQFYLDEEEGLNRPEGVLDDPAPPATGPTEVSEEIGDTEDTSEHLNTRPRCSRSSSRVRFQDDIDIDTRSNASTSSRPCGERWGGYEIPEPEKDLGQEVMYQITQQGFNELLDPLFEDKENNALDESATRDQRHELTDQIDQVALDFRTQEYANNRAICMIGIFRYSRCILDMFVNAVNNVSGYRTFKELFHHDDGTKVTRKEARARLSDIYASLEIAILASISVPDDWSIDDMSLWNTWLCRSQLRDEFIASTICSASWLGWVARPKSAQSPPRDPTMPQFRPNSEADIIAADHVAASVEDSDETDPSPITLNEDLFSSEHDRILAEPEGPFFIFARPGQRLGTDTVGENHIPSSTQTRPLSENLDPAEQDATPGQEKSPSGSIPSWRDYTDDPIIHILHVHNEGGIKILMSLSRIALHSTNPYHPPIDQLRPLCQHIRALAMDPDSKSYYILLASLEAVQQEITERKDSGLISFEEFDVHLQHGRLRFLEAWLEWVSI